MMGPPRSKFDKHQALKLEAQTALSARLFRSTAKMVTSCVRGSLSSTLIMACTGWQQAQASLYSFQEGCLQQLSQHVVRVYGAIIKKHALIEHLKLPRRHLLLDAAAETRAWCLNIQTFTMLAAANLRQDMLQELLL